MGTLFRSPNRIIETYRGPVEFYIAVESRTAGHRRKVVRFRTSPGDKWQPIHQFPGHKPKAINRAFQGYKHSIALALASS